MPTLEHFIFGLILVLGVLILAGLVSIFTFLFYGPKQQPTTIIVQRPEWDSYPYRGVRGGGLPGWNKASHPAPPAPAPAPPAPAPAPPAPPASA